MIRSFQTDVDFIIVALAIFSMIKAMNMLRKKEADQPVAPAKPPPPTEDSVLLREIRDSLEK